MKYVVCVVALIWHSLTISQVCVAERDSLEQIQFDLDELVNRRAIVQQQIAQKEIQLSDDCNQPESEPDVAQDPPEQSDGSETDADNVITPTGSWQDSLIPFIPETPGTIALIPNTELTPVLLPDDGSLACDYLMCDRSHVAITDWTGMGCDMTNGICRFLAMGGHADHGAGSVYSFDIGSLTWTREYDYSEPQAPFPDYDNSDSCPKTGPGPGGSHGYDGVVYVESLRETWKLRTGGFTPRKPRRCQGGISSGAYAFGDNGQWRKLSVPEIAFPRTAYDPVRDKIYFVGLQVPPENKDGLFELDPHTEKYTNIGGIWWAGRGGASMAFDENRDLWILTRGDGVYRYHIAEDGAKSGGRILDDSDVEPTIGVNGCIAATSGTMVILNGQNDVVQYKDGDVESFSAGGDRLRDYYSELGAGRLLGKCAAVPRLPGVIIGIADNAGWFIYRAF